MPNFSTCLSRLVNGEETELEIDVAYGVTHCGFADGVRGTPQMCVEIESVRDVGGAEVGCTQEEYETLRHEAEDILNRH